MKPQIMFDLCVSLPRHITLAAVFSISRVLQDLAGEGLKKGLFFTKPLRIARRESRA